MKQKVSKGPVIVLSMLCALVALPAAYAKQPKPKGHGGARHRVGRPGPRGHSGLQARALQVRCPNLTVECVAAPPSLTPATVPVIFSAPAGDQVQVQLVGPSGQTLTQTVTANGQDQTVTFTQVGFPFGVSSATVTVTDLTTGTISTCTFQVRVQDTTPPTLICQLVPISGENDEEDDDEGDEGLFQVQIFASDVCGPVDVDAFIVCTDFSGNQLPVAVTNGQFVVLKLDEECEAEFEDDVLQVEGPQLALVVQATDAVGNQATCNVPAPLQPEHDNDDEGDQGDDHGHHGGHHGDHHGDDQGDDDQGD